MGTRQVYHFLRGRSSKGHASRPFPRQRRAAALLGLAICGKMWYGKRNAGMERVRCQTYLQREGRRRLKAVWGKRQGKFTPERRGGKRAEGRAAVGSDGGHRYRSMECLLQAKNRVVPRRAASSSLLTGAGAFCFALRRCHGSTERRPPPGKLRPQEKR